jgi:serine protease Do
MKKQFIALAIAVTIVFSGAAGFGGAYLANHLAAAPLYRNTAAASQGGGAALASNTAAAGGSASAAAGAASQSSGNTAAKKALTIPEISSRAANSVVEIYTESIVRGIFLRQYIAAGSASGVIVRADGYIVTNDHVVDGARKITVRLKNGVEHEAAVVGRDAKNDLAVVKIAATGLKAATYGDSGKLVVGELAVAIGNPLGQLGGSVTEGIISALGRRIDIDGLSMTLLQTSAAINPGNSGGGLFNQYGELIGVVNAKSSGYDVEGIGFAIPSNTVKSAVKAMVPS